MAFRRKACGAILASHLLRVETQSSEAELLICSVAEGKPLGVAAVVGGTYSPLDEGGARRI